MHLFLTSSPSGCPFDPGPDVPVLDPSNGFADLLRSVWPGQPPAGLFLSAAPDDSWGNDHMREVFTRCFEQAGLPFCWTALCDRRNPEELRRLLDRCGFVMLCGGHVPTQNDFFRQIGLRDALRDYHGIVMGVSAGSMNAARLVYAEPEGDGEALDPNYPRWMEGLDLTETCIVPHFQMTRGWWLDGMRLLEDIVLPDSHRHPFIALADGSYIYGHEGHETLHGQAWLMAAGQMLELCRDGESLPLK